MLLAPPLVRYDSAVVWRLARLPNPPHIPCKTVPACNLLCNSSATKRKVFGHFFSYRCTLHPSLSSYEGTAIDTLKWRHNNRLVHIQWSSRSFPVTLSTSDFTPNERVKSLCSLIEKQRVPAIANTVRVPRATSVFPASHTIWEGSPSSVACCSFISLLFFPSSHTHLFLKLQPGGTLAFGG